MFGDYELEEDRLGMSLQPGQVTLSKDSQNLIGITIGGGAPLCPCLYVVQVFDNTPAAKDGTLEAGDEITAVNRQSVKGRTKVEVARMIQSTREDVTLNFNKLTSVDMKQGRSLDISVKRWKHRLVERLSSETADALGLSRAILCNDTLIKKMKELERSGQFYQQLVERFRMLLRSHLQLATAQHDLGTVCVQMGTRQPWLTASESLRRYGEAHRCVEKCGYRLLRTLRPLVGELHTYLNHVIPDTHLTVKKYADAKFDYLSFCLKVKEMDDEEYSYASASEPLYRVETGNYEYRLTLRCRQAARLKFARLRSDVLEKMDLLDNKHVQDVVVQLRRLVAALSAYSADCAQHLHSVDDVFPIEVDLVKTAASYGSANFSEDGFEEEVSEASKLCSNLIDAHDDEIIKLKDVESDVNGAGNCNQLVDLMN